MVKDDKDLSFLLGEIVGTQKQILSQIQDNRKNHDARYSETQARLDEHAKVIKEQQSTLESRYEKNAGRIDKLEDEIIQTKGIMKGVLWVAGLIVPAVTWVLRKLEVL